MTAVLSPSSSPSGSPNPNLSTLPPLNTNPPQKRSTLQRPSSYAKDRMSAYSATSNSSQRPSRPASHAFSIFHSSLSYTQVRDFAYPTSYAMHYGPPAESSAAASEHSTPALEAGAGFSDHFNTSWNTARPTWAASEWGSSAHEHLPQMAYGGSQDDHGPPYSEDEDLQSPVVVSSRQKKWPIVQGKDDSKGYDQERGYYAGTSVDGSETYYSNNDSEEMADGPGGELVTYPPDQARHSSTMLYPSSYDNQGADHIETENEGLAPRNPGLEPGSFNTDESRFSRDYQFTIASPDEEMHGKAVALFDFARENENELPLVEGQVIWVSYRHGQGWLVAEDPKTRESGLVPEEYVRLLRDIEGGLNSLSAEASNLNETAIQPSPEVETTDPPAPTSISEDTPPGHHSQGSSGSNGEKTKPVVSTFSTSSKDLDPYHHPLLGTQTGQPPPPVAHYGSQTSTPTLLSPSASKKGDKDKVKRSLSKQKKEKKKDHKS